MRKYILSEIIFLFLFISSIYILSAVKIPLEYDTYVFIYIGITFLITFLVIPAAIILSITEKYAPHMLPSKSKKKNPYSINLQKKSLKFMFLFQLISLGTIIILHLLGFDMLLANLFSAFIASFVFGILYKFYLELKSDRTNIKELILPFIISVLLFIAYFLLLNTKISF